jgi:putative ABC transport system substrate-binding protein
MNPGNNKNSKLFSVFLCFPLLAPLFQAQAQQLSQPARIGYLAGTGADAQSTRLAAFRRGLRELGYVEGKHIVIEERYAEGKPGRHPALAMELVRLKVDIILSAGPATTRAVKKLTDTIPVVMAQDADPVGSGFVASLARPGGNITGFSTLAPEISGKQLELLRETLPKLARLVVLGTSTTPGNAQKLRETEIAAGTFKVQLQHLDVLRPQDIETALGASRSVGVEAGLVLGGPVLNSRRTQVVELAAKNRLPVIYNVAAFVEAGGLMTYSVSIVDLYRRAAIYVDRILKGDKPADLPVEQPAKFEFIINLKAAKQIGLTIPPNVLARADRVIK